MEDRTEKILLWLRILQINGDGLKRCNLKNPLSYLLFLSMAVLGVFSGIIFGLVETYDAIKNMVTWG